MEVFLNWLDDKTQVILVVGAATALMVVYAPEMINQHLDAILAGLFGIVVGTTKRQGV